MFTLEAITKGLRISSFTSAVKSLTKYLEKPYAPRYIPEEHPADLALVSSLATSFKEAAESPVGYGASAQYRMAASVLRDREHAVKSRGRVKSRAAFVEFETGWRGARVGVNAGGTS